MITGGMQASQARPAARGIRRRPVRSRPSDSLPRPAREEFVDKRRSVSIIYLQNRLAARRALLACSPRPCIRPRRSQSARARDRLSPARDPRPVTETAVMATSTESNPPAKDLEGLSEPRRDRTSRSRSSAAGWPRPPRSRRARPIAAKLAAKDEDSQEPARDHGRGQGPDQEPVDPAAQGDRARRTRKFEIPGYQIIEQARQGVDGGRLQGEADRASTGSSPSRSCSTPWRRTRNSSSGSTARPRSPPSSRTTTSSTPSTPARSTAITTS